MSTNLVLRPLGNPLPLGFLALAAGTLTLSGLQLGWVPAGESGHVALALVAFVAPLQLLSAILCFLARDAVAGVGMGLTGGGWLVIGLVTLASPSGATSAGLGLFLLAVAADLAVPALTSARSKLLAAAVIGGTGLRFALTGVYELNGASGWADAAGAVGLGLFALAFYAGLALDLADAAEGEGPLPVGRAEGGAPVESDPAAGLEHEAGVRRLL